MSGIPTDRIQTMSDTFTICRPPQVASCHWLSTQSTGELSRSGLYTGLVVQLQMGTVIWCNPTGVEKIQATSTLTWLAKGVASTLSLPCV